MYDGPKVFLSSTGLDLSEYRDAILKAIAETEWFRCVAQENFGIAPAYPRDVCLGRVHASDLFVAVVGHYRGSEIDGDNARRSFTEFEYDTAIESGKLRFVAVQPDDHPGVQPRYVSKGEQGDRQEAFRQRVMKDVVVGLKFGSPDKVAGQVVNALWKHFAIKQALATAPKQDRELSQVATDAFAQAVSEMADEQIIDPEKLAKGIEKFDRELILDEVIRRGEALSAEADAAGKAKRQAAARHFRHVGAIAGLGDPARARTAYAKAAELDPDHADGIFRHGWFQWDCGNLSDAERAFRRVHSLGNQSTSDRASHWARLGLGDIALARGDLADALSAYDQAREAADRLAKADPGNAGWQRDLSVSQEKIGNVLVQQGNLPAALASYQASLAIADRLAKIHPGNAGRQYDLGISNERVGDVFMAQGHLNAALNHYRTRNDIISHLAKTDPDNAGWQRDLSVAHSRIGDVLVEQGNLPAALTSYQAALAIRDRLAKADPGNAGWQRDLSVAHNKIGDVLGQQGNLPAALTSYQADLAIADCLAKADQGNAGWLADLAASRGKLGLLLEKMGKPSEALTMFHEGLNIVRPLVERAPDHQLWRGYLAGFETHIARLEQVAAE